MALLMLATVPITSSTPIISAEISNPNLSTTAGTDVIRDNIICSAPTAGSSPQQALPVAGSEQELSTIGIGSKASISELGRYEDLKAGGTPRSPGTQIFYDDFEGGSGAWTCSDINGNNGADYWDTSDARALRSVGAHTP